MPSRFSALCDDHVRTGLRRLKRLHHGLYLADEPRTRRVDGGRKGSRISERKHDGGRLVPQDAIQQLRALRQAPSDEAATDPSIIRAGPFPLKPFPLTVAAAKKAKPTRLAHSRGDSAAGYNVHRGQQHRVLDVQPLSPLLRPELVSEKHIHARSQKEFRLVSAVTRAHGLPQWPLITATDNIDTICRSSRRQRKNETSINRYEKNSTTIYHLTQNIKLDSIRLMHYLYSFTALRG